ncbi:hypothetical protein ACM46_04520 [Chryseobacterium angstadtii]|uniref:Uncharacterized protein n=1 Tax=Chryseobacterium angstadtii TaxID=558151 RepID=A0A0J7ILL4_9FLAO|nr:hypothetical protein [Chryseobacterium angstadtii]KMQ66774.1 hypothetical protein ACM46_04520 [Chryseobacterium angstadtii]
MNTFRDNFENGIKKQIEEREIAPSRDLWADIALQTRNRSSKYNVNWILAAACLVLVCGLGFVLFFNTEKENTKDIDIAVVKKETPQTETSTDVKQETNPVLTDRKQHIAQENSSKAAEVSAPKALTEEIQKLSIKEKGPLIAPVIPKMNAEKIMAQSIDSSKSPVKSKKYVDPSTLLFSVEHKDMIQKTKESNVASVDLNER